MPSLVSVGRLLGVPNRATALVSLSQTRTCGMPSASEHVPAEEPVLGLDRLDSRPAPTVVGSSRRSAGLRSSRPHAQVLRNQSCGSRCSGAGSGPWLVAVDHDADVVRRGLGVGDHDVEEPVLVEHPGVGQLVLPARRDRVGGSARAARAYGILGLRIAVEPPHPRVGGRAVHGPPVLLDVLAVVALAVGQTEQPFLEDRVAPVPQRDGEVEESDTGRRCRRGRPRPSGRRGRGPARTADKPRRRRRRSSPRGRCPTGVRTGTGPTAATGAFAARRLGEPGVLGAAGQRPWTCGVVGTGHACRAWHLRPAMATAGLERRKYRCRSRSVEGPMSADPVLLAEREHLDVAAECLAEMQESAARIADYGVDELSSYGLGRMRAQRLAALSADPDAPPFFGRTDRDAERGRRRGLAHRPAPRPRSAGRPGRDRLARADRAGVLPGHTVRPDGRAVAPAVRFPQRRADLLRGRTPRSRRGVGPEIRSAARRRSSARASDRCATSSRPSSPTRTISSAPIWTRRCASRARPAPARPRSGCTGPRTCSTPIPSGLRRSGVLVIGPNNAFLHYIAQVLPALGEGGIEQTTVDELVRHVPVRATEAAAVATLKGDARMADVLRRAVLSHVARPTGDLLIIKGTRRYRVAEHRLRRYVDDARRADDLAGQPRASGCGNSSPRMSAGNARTPAARRPMPRRPESPDRPRFGSSSTPCGRHSTRRPCSHGCTPIRHSCSAARPPP